MGYAFIKIKLLEAAKIVFGRTDLFIYDNFSLINNMTTIQYSNAKLFKMEKYYLQNDLNVFGMQVKTFPKGIGEAFEALIKMISGKFDRDYFGISYMTDDGGIVYYAAAVEKQQGEAEKYNCERYILEKGDYLTIPVKEWRMKTDCIKEVFHEIMLNPGVDKTKPAVEWYYNDDEMMCMIKMIPTPK
jgi:predicted transcriptional regulator YdeE